MSFTKVAPAGIGTEPGNSILIGDSLLHSTGIDIGSNTGIGVTIRKHGDATFTGIITASAFFGDGSGLEGVSSSGIGTPLSDDDTSDLNKIYYVNQELSIGSTVTVNHPSSAVASYTHYQDLVVTDDADFIVSDGDTFIPDVLGIRTSTSTASAATGGRIRAGTITNAGANGAPNFPNGLTGTAGTFTGNLNVGGVLTYEDVTNVDSVGVITARSGIRIGATGANSIINGNADGIGINTAAASSLGLEVSSPFNDIARITGPNSGNITFRNATANEVILHTGNSDALIFGTNGNNERIRIGTAGQIGIAGANYGTSGQVLTSQGASSAVTWSTISAGTEVYDTWIYTAETNVYAAGNYLTSNWSRFGDNIGSAMTQSSGVFSFPSTGFYRVTFTCNFFERNSPDNIAYIYIQITTNNSSYTTRVASLQNITDRSGDTYTTCHAHCLFDVTNTTTHKVRFFAASDDSGDLRIAGASSYQQVYATFQKMANT